MYYIFLKKNWPLFGPPTFCTYPVSTHFESLEKSAKPKVQKEFNNKRFDALKGLIGVDRMVLDASVKSIQNALPEGGNVYTFCLSYPKVIKDIEDKIKVSKKKLSSVSKSFDHVTVSVASKESQAISLIEDIKKLTKEKESIEAMMSELRGLISPKMEAMFNALTEAQAAA